MKKYFFISFFIFGLVGFLALAQGEDIIYPVAELGNCGSKEECMDYCDSPENMEPCLDFAEKHNLIPAEEIKVARDFLAGEDGPGGCNTKDKCEQYCNDISHIDECIAFAEDNNLMPPEELAEAKKVQAAIARGVQPPPCTSKDACDAYCEDPSNMEACITFAEEAGFLEGNELEDAKKMLSAIQRGVQPPPCAGRDACDEYCSAPENMEVCMNFAIEAGFMNEQEKAEAQKMLQAIKKGVIPPKCRSREECDAYCGQEEHLEECMNFAIAAGFMSEKDAEMARKTGGKGPGNCRGKEECEAFCNDPVNQENCFNFAKEHGLISEEDLKQMEEGKQQMQQALSQAPPEVLECLQLALGDEKFEEIKNGTAMPSREIGDLLQTCFQNMMPPGQEGMGPGQEMQFGPGGCQGEEECVAYCENPDHSTECVGFMVQTGQMSPEEAEQIMRRAMEQGGGGQTEQPEREIPVYDPNRGGLNPIMPEDMNKPSQEEIDKMHQEEAERFMQEEARKTAEEEQRRAMEFQQRQIEEEQKRLMEQQPQSLLDRVQNFLAGLIAP